MQERALPLGQFLPESWPDEQAAAAPFKAAAAQTHARKTYP
jgi:hypothetical protein